MSELLIKNGMVYTYIYEGYHAIKQREADVFIKDGSIEEVAPDINRDCDTLDATDCLVLPGMVNVAANTFASRITSGLICDWTRGEERIAPMLDMSAELMTEDEIKAIALTGLWETARSGATAVIELSRSAGGKDKDHPLYYRSEPEVITEAVLKAGEELGLHVFSGCGDEDGNLLINEGGDRNRMVPTLSKACIKGSILAGSAVTCADLGCHFSGYPNIRAGAMMTMGTGITSNCMIHEMSTTARAVKTMSEDPFAYRASDVFYSATVVGGRELDENKYGRLGPGFYGNISVVDMKRFKPLSYPLNQYIYGATAEDVIHVICEGEPIKRVGNPSEKINKLLPEAYEISESAITRLWEEARKTII